MKHIRRLLLLASPLVAVFIAVFFLAKSRNPGGHIASAHQGPPLTDAECQAYGQDVEAAISAGDSAKVNGLFRLQELDERVINAMRISEKARETLLSSTRNKLDAFAETFIKGVADGGGLSLRVRRGDAAPTVLFRFIQPNGGLNYVEVTPARHPDGKIVADEIYSIAMGDKLTQLLRHLYIKIAGSDDPRVLSNLSGNDRLYYDNASAVQATLAAFNQAGKKKDAYDAYLKLPAELRKEKALLLAALVSAQGVGEDEYRGMLDTYRNHYPTDPAFDLLGYGYFVLKKDFKKAHESIDRLDSFIGGDPYLSLRRGSLMVEEGRYADAKAEYAKAIEKCPGYADILWPRITLAAIEKNHDDTLAWFKEAVVQCGMAIDEPSLREFDKLGPFLNSPQYQQLLEWQRDRGM